MSLAKNQIAMVPISMNCAFSIALTDRRFRVKIDQHGMVLMVESVTETEDIGTAVKKPSRGVGEPTRRKPDYLEGGTRCGMRHDKLVEKVR